MDKSAWVHHCGHVNLGMWTDRAVCGGCRVPVVDAEDVEQYRLARIW
ncbi:hypothetical protein [Nonomuraea sp. NPDC049504]